MRIDDNFQKKIDAGDATAVVRHVQSDSAISIHVDLATAETDASQRNVSAENLGLTARYEAVSLKQE